MANVYKSKDAKKVRDFDIVPLTKGFTSEYIDKENKIIKEYFHFRHIYQIIHHVDTGVEIVLFNDTRRVFYNDDPGLSLELFEALHAHMINFMSSNLN